MIVLKLFISKTIRTELHVLERTYFICLFDTSTYKVAKTYKPLHSYEPRRVKTDFLHIRKKSQISCAVTAHLIRAFVFATQIVQSLFFLITIWKAQGVPK